MHPKKEEFRVNQATAEKTSKTSIFKGLFYALLSGISFSLGALIVKHLKNLHPGQLAMYRYISVFIMSIPETVMSRQKFWRTRKVSIIMVIRGIFGGLSGFLNFIAFRYLGLGEAMVIILSMPAFVTVLARIVLKEPCSMLQTFIVILTVIGIILTSRLPTYFSENSFVYSSEKMYGFLAAVLSLCCLSTLTIFTRKVKFVHSSILNFHFAWVGMVVVTILTALFGNFRWHHCGMESVFILLHALISYSGITLFVMAVQCEYAGPVVTVRSAVDIFLSFLWQIFIFRDVPDVYGITGAVLVSFCVVLAGFNKWIVSSESNLLSFRKFKCF